MNVENTDMIIKSMVDIVDKIRMDERMRITKRLVNHDPAELSIDGNWKYDRLLEVVSVD